MSNSSAADRDRELVLAIDVGTSSVRALACDAEGNAIPVTETQRSYRLHTTRDGGAEYDATALFELLCDVIDETLATVNDESATFIAVGVTSFWHSLLGLDKDRNPVTPLYFWADSRADQTIDGIKRQRDLDRIWQRTGCRLHSSYWPAKLHWLRESQPRLSGEVDRWVSFTEYVHCQLTGEAAPVMSFSMASGTGLLDVHELVWDDELLAVLGVEPAKLPALVDIDHRAVVNRHFSRRWRALQDVPWIPALGDGACANVGSAAIGPGRITLTLGTSGAMRMVLPAPPGSTWSVPAGLWAYRLDREYVVLGGALSNGGNVRRWISDLTGLQMTVENTAAIAALPADGHGLTILPFVAGERSPGWHGSATGLINGLTLASTPIDLARATLEAVAYRFARIYDALLPIAASPHQIVANGGAIVSSPEWTQIIASTLGHDILALPAGDEATARGAAIMALRSVGALSSLDAAPDPSREATRFAPSAADHSRYQAGRRRQESLEAMLYPAADLDGRNDEEW
ncbi:MAG: gluconokinase [Chloroflexota bacterium]|nr:gluconokinase [Chloroflexota bacterium]